MKQTLTVLAIAAVVIVLLVMGAAQVWGFIFGSPLQFAQTTTKDLSIVAQTQAEALLAEGEADKVTAESINKLVDLVEKINAQERQQRVQEAWTYRIAMICMIVGLFSLPWLGWLGWKQYKLNEAEARAKLERSTKHNGRVQEPLVEEG